MSEIGAFEAKNTLGTLLDRVEQGEEIIITRHGKPVARLVPNAERVNQAQAQAALRRMRERAHVVRKGKSKKHSAFDWAAVKQLRDAGRP